MDTKLINKIKKDLEKSGLGSEMKALKVFNELGWKIESGTSYFDKDEGKSREIDISAYFPSNLYLGEKVGVYNFFFICAEVKKSDKPWIVFKSPLKKFAKGCAWENMISYINFPNKPRSFTQYLKTNSLLSKVNWQATGLHQSFKDPNFASRWYSAFVTVCKACEEEYDSESCEGNKTSSDLVKNPTELNFFQPIVILDGILATAELSDDGEIIIEEIESAPFRFEFKTEQYKRGRYRVDLVTLKGLKKYLKSVRERQESMNTAFQKVNEKLTRKA